MCTNTNKNLNFNNPNMFGRENFDLDISYCDWSDIGIDLNIDIVFKLISEWKTFGQKIFLGCRIDMQNVRCRIGIADIIFNVGAILHGHQRAQNPPGIPVKIYQKACGLPIVKILIYWNKQQLPRALYPLQRRGQCNEILRINGSRIQLK
jgi:hypothetical protein